MMKRLRLFNPKLETSFYSFSKNSQPEQEM
jgi:hypothetical protein